MTRPISIKHGLVGLAGALAAVALLSAVVVRPGGAATTKDKTAGSSHAKHQTPRPSIGTATILLGSVAGTSGADASTGVATLDGALLAVADVNKTGGVTGKKLTLQSYDDQASQTLAATLYKRLVKAGAVAVLGSNDAGAATAATADQLHIPDLGVLDNSATTPLPWVWNGGPNSAAVGQLDAAYALKSCHGLALAHDTSAYGLGGQAAVKLAYAKAHKTLALDTAISENLKTGATVPFAKLVKQIKASGASCVLAWLTPQDTASLAQTIKATNLKPHLTLIADDAVVTDQTFALLAGAAANGTIAPELTTQLHPSTALQAFTKAYQAKFHTAPTADAITSYDAVLTLAAAIKQERSTSPSKLQAALNSLSASPELQGTVTFTQRDHATVSAGQLTLVSYDAPAKAWKPLP